MIIKSHLMCSSFLKISLMLVISCMSVFTCVAQNQTASEDTVLLFSLPSPDEILDYVVQGNVKFDKNLIIDTKTDRFVSAPDKYIAMGMILTDLAYSVGFKQYGTSFKLFEAVNTLGAELNIISPQIDDVKERFMNNMENQDSLKAIYYEVYEMVMVNFYENNRFNHYTLISSGIYIESLFLSLNTVDKNLQNREFKHRVWEQKMVFDHLSEMINKNLDSNTKNRLNTDLLQLGQTFKLYSASTPPDSFRPRRHDNVIVIGNNQPEVDLEKAIPHITTEIQAVRLKWVK